MAEPSCQSTDLKYQAREIDRLELTLSRMRLEGIPKLSTPFRAVSDALSGIRSQFGFKIPRPVSLLVKLYGLSPGTITLWHDAESGFFTEAREKPGVPPVYHHVTDDVAMTILKGELTHELETTLMTLDPYIGE